MSQRRSVLIGVGIPILFVMGILAWGVFQNNGASGRPGVNDSYGEVPVTGQEGADFTLTTLDGKQVTLSDLKGKIVMVDFWSSWCGPCQSEAAAIEDAYKTWHDKGVEFVGVAIWDQESDVRNFVKGIGTTYPVAIDPNGQVAIEFGVRGIPEKFFVTPDGQIVKKVIGPNTKRNLDNILGQMVDASIGIPSSGSQ